jgi:hypothetical protein
VRTVGQWRELVKWLFSYRSPGFAAASIICTLCKTILVQLCIYAEQQEAERKRIEAKGISDFQVRFNDN